MCSCTGQIFCIMKCGNTRPPTGCTMMQQSCVNFLSIIAWAGSVLLCGIRQRKCLCAFATGRGVLVDRRSCDRVTSRRIVSIFANDKRPIICIVNLNYYCVFSLTVILEAWSCNANLKVCVVAQGSIITCILWHHRLTNLIFS